eukprot:498776-Amphidinium_carterae.1
MYFGDALAWEPIIRCQVFKAFMTRSNKTWVPPHCPGELNRLTSQSPLILREKMVLSDFEAICEHAIRKSRCRSNTI